MEKQGIVKDLSEVIPTAIEVEGEQTTAEKLVGKTIVVRKYGLRPSKFEGTEEYATIQILGDNGNPAWFNTSSGPILDTLKQIEGSLPVRCKVASEKSAKGRRYFALVSAKE